LNPNDIGTVDRASKLIIESEIKTAER